MRRRTLLLSLLALGATACADQARGPATRPAVPSAGPDPLLADPPRGIWPAQYRSAAETTKQAYRYAVERPDVLRWMPCFCGCVSDGHKSNLDCFVRERLAEGRVILDAHGFG